MPYRYLDDIAPADAAFEARGSSREEMFIAAADALMNVMVENLKSITPSQFQKINLQAGDLEMLLYRLLEELIFHKDANKLLLRISNISFQQRLNTLSLDADAYGEELNPGKHALNVDVKAVTLHRFEVEETSDGWTATVVLDI